MTTSPAKSIFFKALDITDSDALVSYLDEHCGDDAYLRAQVEELLAIRRQGESNPLDAAVAQLGSVRKATSELAQCIAVNAAPGTLIGRFKIRELLAEGGMGVVYVAEQFEPVRRKVALKVIKPGMATKDVLMRFEAERQALAMMDHPNIARVFDGGATETGQPYFVMELVQGVPITDYCDSRKLNIRQRLLAVKDVCLAVQHAHQKGIIHRDIKPSNVLVAEIDGRMVPKVIDFGVAKAIDRQLGKETVYTRFLQMVGTPIYMSPEQAGLGVVDIDTRSDIYALGTLLYEILTGQTPFDREVLKRAGPDEVRRIILEVQPRRPSVLLSTLDAKTLSTISAKRCSQPSKLRDRVKGELDWVVMKAMEKDRSRRYDSAQALAEDLDRYLRDEPVVAHPPSKLYQMRKLVHRRWRPLLAASLLAMTIIIGGIASAILAARATLAEAKAVKAEQAAEERAARIQRMLYASDLALASQAWQRGDVQAARQRLAQHIPAAGETDLRGFEWHFLWKQQQVQGIEVAELGAAVYDIALSADGSQFATAGADGIIRGFAADSLALQWQINSAQGETNGIAFSPDGARLAACGDDGTLRLWQLDSLRPLFSVKAHQGLAFQVVFSPDGSLIATCGQDQHVCLWNAHDGQQLGILNQHDAPLETLTISRSGLVAAADEHSGVTIYDIAQRKQLFQFRNPRPEAISAISYSSRGDLAYATVGGVLCVRDSHDTWSYRRRLADGIRSLAFSPNGFSIVVGDQSGNMRLQPIETGWDSSPSREWKAHESRIYAVEFMPDGQRVLSGGEDGKITCWRPFDSGSRRTIRAPAACDSIAVLGPDRLALGCEGMVVLCDFAGNILRKIHASEGNWLIDAAVEPGLLVGMTREKIVGWEIETGRQRFAWAHEPGLLMPGNPLIASDGRAVVFVGQLQNGDRELHVLDVQTLTISTRIPVRSALSMAISPDGRWLAYDSNNDIQLVDLHSGKIAHTWPAHSAGIGDMQFTPDGRLGTVSSDRHLKLWSVENGRLLYSALAHRTDAQRLAIRADGRIATGGDDRMLRMWDGRSNQSLWEFPLDAGRVRKLEFSMDGSHLFSLSNHYEILVFDATPAE